MWLKSEVKIKLLSNGRKAKLLAPLSYESEYYIWNTWVGMIFDGASIPWIFWGLVGSPFTGKYRRWAVMHDAYYQRHRSRSRKQVDRQFLMGMIEDEVPSWKAWLIYFAVRVGGKWAWK